MITLGIIGVVAALTLPTLIAQQKEKETAVKLKKFNSIINQSFQLAVKEYGEIDTWGVGTAGTGVTEDMTEDNVAKQHSNQQEILNRLTKNLKVLSKCDYDAPCQNKLQYTRHAMQGFEYSTFTPRVQLADGTSILSTTFLSPTCKINNGNSKVLQNICGEIFIDINGSKAPNATGKDVFLFYITKYGIVPMGSQSEINKNGSKAFNTHCSMTEYTEEKLNGYGCTAWVIENENMDYLHCNDLSWEGKRKCK